MSAKREKIRVLVVEDSAFMRKVLRGMINADPQMEVAGEARDGREAVSLAESLRPDVITMDINMPRMDGLEATDLIMSRNPRPIIIVSSVSKEGAASTLRALELGAVEFIPKPSSGVDLDMEKVRDELSRKLKMAAKVRVVRTAGRGHGGAAPARVCSGMKPEASEIEDSARLADSRFPLVVIAASTGGPAAIMRLAPSFPREFPGSLILVQHMPPAFTSQFSLQLAGVASMRVKEAEQNEALQPGTIYVCPGLCHLRISPAGRIELDRSGRISGYLPCADVTMETVATYAGRLAIGVVLTGMGNDAADGVRAIKRAGGLAIAQDEATCIIFGMPAEAIKTGAVDHVLPLEEIYPAVEKHVQQLCRAAQVSMR